MAFSPLFTWQRSSDCLSANFTDTTCVCPSGYLAPNPTKAEVTSTVITISDDLGNSCEYTGYLPTQGTVTLTFENFTQTIVVEPTVTDTGCGCVTENVEVSTWADGCKTIQYEVFVDDDLIGSTSDTFLFYCMTRNRIFDQIVGSCSDCCDTQKQHDIHETRDLYDDMLTVFNKIGCGDCVDGMLRQIDKKLNKLEGNC